MNSKLKILAASLAMASVSAQAVELLTGPPSPKAKGSFPTYYQDLNGLALEHCLPTPGAELNSAACLIGAADVPNPLLPITFPGNFPGETFFFAADSSVPFNNGEEALLVMALEATFGAEEPVEGDQILFARVRFRFVAPVDGEYTVTYPYGQKVVQGIAGERIFDTDDTGVTCGMDFSCAATNGQIGPIFLRPSAISGGDPLPFYEANGKTYIANPGVETPVTGGSFGNIFRIDGPPGSSLGGPGVDFVETDLFTLVGRVKTDPLPSNISIQKSTYSRAADDNLTKIDVNVKTVSGLLQPDPQLVLFGKNMPGVNMTKDGVKKGQYYGQLTLPGNTVPDKVFISDLLETPSRVIPVNLVDQITVRKAVYNQDTGLLHIEAESSDKSNSHSGSLKLNAYGSDGKAFGEIGSDGELDVTLAAGEVPPAKVLVVSNRHGSDSLEVTTMFGAPPVVQLLLTAGDDGVDETQPISVLANDTVTPTVKVRIVDQPIHGTVVVNDADDTVSFSQSEPVADGTDDSFTYYLTDADGNISNISTVSFTLSGGNLPPTANPDSASVSAGSMVSINVLANDTDPETDALTLVSVEAGVGAVINGNNIDYTAPAGAGGTQQTFNYTVQDSHGNTATGVVTVDISVPVSLTIDAAEYRTSKQQWRVAGTITPPLVGVTMTIYVDINRDGTFNTVSELLGVSLPTDPDGVGAWDFRTTTSPLAGAAGVSYPIKVVSSMGVERTGTLLTRR